MNESARVSESIDAARGLLGEGESGMERSSGRLVSLKW